MKLIVFKFLIIDILLLIYLFLIMFMKAKTAHVTGRVSEILRMFLHNISH